MQINDIFDLSQYNEAFIFVSKNEGTSIKDLGNGRYQIVELPKLSLDELKDAKREEINTARNKAEQGGFTYMGKVFDSDPISCIRISAAAQAMQVAPMAEETPIITWTCQDNTTIDLNAAELLGLVVALAEWSNTCHQKATTIKELLEECQTPEEVEKISWDMELDAEKPEIEPIPEETIPTAPDVNAILSK